jgi:phenylacetate-CoA ligase
MLDLTPRREDLDPIEIASRDEIAALQLARLKRTLRHVYDNVAHYWKAFDAAGVHPDDLNSLADLAKFPLTSKEDLRANYPFGLFAVPREQIVRVHASSGTTGKPTVVGYTHHDLDVWADLMARSLRAAGCRPADLVHVAYGYGLFTGGLGAHYGAERLGCTVVPVSGGMTARQVQLIVDFAPRVIMVTPSYFLAILDEMDAQGIDPRATGLEIGIFGAEPWTDEMRHAVEERSGIRAVDIYGLSEVMGPGVSQESGVTQDGLHVWEDHFLPEVVDPETGQVLDDGEPGELVITSLTKQALPIVRYRTGDMTCLRPGTARPSFRRMDKVVGRNDDMIILRGVNVYPSQLEEVILDVAGLTPHYVCVLTRPGRLDALTVEVERTGSTDPRDAGILADRLVRLVKERIGVTIDVVVVDPDQVERSGGKANRVVDRRDDT